MPESGGPATQTGIYYQNSIAALALADLLDLDQRVARERVVEVRLEAPEQVDDIVLRFADGHYDYQSVKLSLRVGNAAWKGLWRSLHAQHEAPAFGPTDQLTVIVSERNTASDAVAVLCERAAASIDRTELGPRLDKGKKSALASIETIIGGAEAALALLRRTRLLHLAQNAVESELGRRRLAGGLTGAPALLPLLRDIAGGASRRRALFQAAPLRRKLKLEHNLLLGEPPEWGLDAYRIAVRQLARIEIPGTTVAGPAEQLFIWPRARNFDATRRADFEDENPNRLFEEDEATLDLRTFPIDQFDRLVVVGGPGQGKSALLTAVAGRLAEGPFVPMAVSLASLAAADTSVLQFLSSAISQELDLTADWQRLAEQGLLVLLLDGLDEVPTTVRPTVMRRLAYFSVRYPKSPWILTVRDAAVLTGLPEATVVELLPLNDSDLERFAEAMRAHIGDLQPWELVRRLKLYPDLDRLARIPLFLMLLLATTNLNDPRPLTRADLIETYLSILFAPARHKPVLLIGDRNAVLRTIAETLAFERLEKQEIGATEREVREVINRIITNPAEAEDVLEQLKANGILKPQSAIRLQFPYPIVQEYLAARHLVDHYPENLGQRIEDAIQRPWAQVIQFALELHPDPEPVITAMLAREDDAFATGLRLVGRCIANGARVSEALCLQVGEQLVAFWIHAPSQSRERVGRLLADGFADLSSEKLDAALHHRWLINDGAGDILSKRKDLALTLSVLARLIADDNSSMGIYHSFKEALRSAGDPALRQIIAGMDPETTDAETIIQVSGLLWNFTPQSVSRELALEVARDVRLPTQARMRAYKLAGAPLEDAGVTLGLDAFRQDDWNRNYAATDLIDVHADPPAFLETVLRDISISVDRRRDLAASIGSHITDPAERSRLARVLIADSSVDAGIRSAIQLVEARYGDVSSFKALVEELPRLPVEHAATTIALFGHYPDQELAEHAAALMRIRNLTADELVRIASSVNTGFRYIFEMDWAFGGLLRAAPPHPGIAAWIQLLEDWSDRADLDAHNRLKVRTAAAELGSEAVRAVLECDLLSIEDFDAEVWRQDDEGGLTMSHAIRQLRRRLPIFPSDLIDRILNSSRYNIASDGVMALSARGDRDALLRLIDLHGATSEWLLRDLAANTIELLAARLNLVVRKAGTQYVLP